MQEASSTTDQIRDATIRCASIWRYPLKGFAGQRLDCADLEPGSGIPGDRRFGLTNGTSAVVPQSGWSSSKGFVRLLVNADLPSLPVRFGWSDARQGENATPASQLRAVDLHDAAGREAAAKLLVRLIGSTGDATGTIADAVDLSGRGSYWDHPDGAVSIINLETVKDIETVVGTPIDPARFRANFYVSGLPAWHEFGLVGWRVQLGDGGPELEVLRPINRCRATSVNPATGGRDLNLPLALTKHYGHVFCGIYARVVRGGAVKAGDSISSVSSQPEALRDGATSTTSPPIASHPRFATVIDRVAESSSVVSVWLEDPLIKAGLLREVRAGQHLRLHFHDDLGPTWRAYTISGHALEKGALRISVKLEPAVCPEHPPGRGSSYVHSRLLCGSKVLVTGPHGDFRLSSALPAVHSGNFVCPESSVILASAGIGITPVLSMVQELALHTDPGDPAAGRGVHIVHQARSASELALWPELHDIVRTRLPAATLRLFLSQAKEVELLRFGAEQGRLDFSNIGPAEGLERCSAYICGPQSFQDSARSSLVGRDVPPDRIFSEAFVSPLADLAQAPRASPHLGPFAVTFALSNVKTTWSATDGSLLDLAESLGLTLPASCRGGGCQRCRQRVLSGATAHLVDLPMAIEPSAALLCCAVPTSDISIQA